MAICSCRSPDGGAGDENLVLLMFQAQVGRKERLLGERILDKETMGGKVRNPDNVGIELGPGSEATLVDEAETLRIYSDRITHA